MGQSLTLQTLVFSSGKKKFSQTTSGACVHQWLFFFFFDCSRGLLRPELPLVMVHGLGCSLAYGILVPQPGVKPMSPALGGGLLATGPAGKSHQWLFSFLSNSTCICLQPLPASQNQGPHPGLLLHKFLVCSGQNREVIEVRRVQWHVSLRSWVFFFFQLKGL